MSTFREHLSWPGQVCQVASCQPVPVDAGAGFSGYRLGSWLNDLGVTRDDPYETITWCHEVDHFHLILQIHKLVLHYLEVHVKSLDALQLVCNCDSSDLDHLLSHQNESRSYFTKMDIFQLLHFQIGNWRASQGLRRGGGGSSDFRV
jgi:hypothetical protein